MAQHQTQENGRRKLPNAIRVQKFLGGIDYPVKKRELLDKARENGADEDTLTLLEDLPDREYDGPTAISHLLSKGH